MSTKVEISGHRFSFVGTFEATTHEQLEALIRARGGDVVGSPNAQTDYVVAGVDPAGTQFSKALALGIPVLGEQDIEDVLAGEDVFLDEDEEHEDANVLFGEAREWLHGMRPSAELWQDLTDLLDRCPVNQQAALVSYIDSFFSAWRVDGSMASLTGYPIELESVRHTRVAGGYWKYGVPGELRVAPERWVGELKRGKRSPKLRLIRALDLVWSDINGRDVCAILAHPDLTHLDTLNLSLSKPLTKQLIRALCAAPTRDKLETLMVGQLQPRNDIWWFEASDTPSALRSLDVSQYHALITFDFLEAPYFENLKSLAIAGLQTDALHAAMPSGIENLEVRAPKVSDMRALLREHTIASTLRNVTLRDIDHACLIHLLGDSYDGHLTTLECFLPSYQRLYIDKRMTRDLHTAICQSPMLERVERLVLGSLSLFGAVNLDEIAKHHPHLDVVRE